MFLNKNKCTEITIGTITQLKSKGLESPTLIYVDYEVNGKIYKLKETIKLRSEAIKIGWFPIGQKNLPLMGDIRVGNSAKVSYNPEDPSEAYLIDNIGIRNV